MGISACNVTIAKAIAEIPIARPPNDFIKQNHDTAPPSSHREPDRYRSQATP
jgi:hypothetical protein